MSLQCVIISCNTYVYVCGLKIKSLHLSFVATSILLGSSDVGFATKLLFPLCVVFSEAEICKSMVIWRRQQVSIFEQQMSKSFQSGKNTLIQES